MRMMHVQWRFLCICKCIERPLSTAKHEACTWGARELPRDCAGREMAKKAKMAKCSLTQRELMREIKWKKFVARRMRGTHENRFFRFFFVSPLEAAARKCNFLTGFSLFTAITRINFVCTRILFDLQPHLVSDSSAIHLSKKMMPMINFYMFWAREEARRDKAFGCWLNEAQMQPIEGH